MYQKLIYVIIKSEWTINHIKQFREDKINVLTIFHKITNIIHDI